MHFSIFKVLPGGRKGFARLDLVLVNGNTYYVIDGANRFLFSFRKLYPTDHFTILYYQNRQCDVPELHKIRRSPNLEALKL